MATESALEALQEIHNNFEAIDIEKLIRKYLGEKSMEKEFIPRHEEWKKKLKFFIEYAPGVNNEPINEVISIYREAISQMNNRAEITDPNFLNTQDEFITYLDNSIETLKKLEPHFVSSAVLTRGLLEDEGIKKENERAIEAMKRESQLALETIKEEAEKTIAEAKGLAEQIETKARDTVRGVSVKEAQDQFEEAQKHHKSQMILWSIITGGVVALFLYVAYQFYVYEFPQKVEIYKAVYKSVLRIIILGAIGAIAAFSLRILRAHMHMRQHSLHRKRIAKSMASFVESAITKEQRDIILAQLVDAVAAFGTSGLLRKEDESIHSSKMIVDNISRSIGGSSSQ